MDERSPLRIATRASRLALWQAHHVADLLRAADPQETVELIEVSTHGDRDRQQPLTEAGGVGVFTREVQQAVLDGRADLAVHSLKDLPTAPIPGLTLAGVPGRGPRFDLLLLPKGSSDSMTSIDDLPADSRIGTGSPRRQAQLLHHRFDLTISDIRGNVETRLQKLDDGAYDAIVLAQAGLHRLGLDSGRPSLPLEPPLMLPAVGQAALGLECRADDDATIALLAAVTDAIALAEVTAERACLHELQAGCHAPVGTFCEIDGDSLSLHTVVLSTDGATRMADSTSGHVADAEAIGRKLASQLLDQGAADLINIT